MAETRAAGLLAMMGVFDLIGTTLSGWLTDRYDPRKLLFVYYALRGLSLIYLPFSDFSLYSLSIFAVFYGLDWIATVPPTLALTREAFGERDAPIVFGWIMVGHQMGAATAAMGAGLIRVIQGRYLEAFVIAGRPVRPAFREGPGVQARQGADPREAGLARRRQFGRHHRAVEVIHERRDHGIRRAGIARGPHADRRIDAVRPEVERSVGFHHPQGDLWMGGLEPRQARDQPFHAEGRQARDDQRTRPHLRRARHGGLDLVEGRRQALGQFQPRLGHSQSRARPLGQGHAQLVLKLADLPADRAVGDAQLVGRQRHPPMPRERLEGAQGVERRQGATGHVMKPHRSPTDKSLSRRIQPSDKADMQPHRITPAQLIALAVIWSAVAYGVTVGGQPEQTAHAETARLVACR
jgi:hypothetical protein